MSLNITDISSQIEHGEEMPLCPLCDNVIEQSDEVAIGAACGVLGLVHEFCIEHGED